MMQTRFKMRIADFSINRIIFDFELTRVRFNALKLLDRNLSSGRVWKQTDKPFLI